MVLIFFRPGYLGRTVRFFIVEPVVDVVAMIFSKITETFF